MATHSNILAWRIPWTEVSGGLYSPWDREESDMTEQLTETQIKIKKKKKSTGQRAGCGQVVLNAQTLTCFL